MVEKASASVAGSGSYVQCKHLDLEQGTENIVESKGQSDGKFPMQTTVADEATNVSADNRLYSVSGTTVIAGVTSTNSLNSSAKGNPDLGSDSNPGSSFHISNSNSSGNDGGSVHQSSRTQECSPRSVISESQLRPTDNQVKAVPETCEKDRATTAVAESMPDIESDLKSMSKKQDQYTQNTSAPSTQENRHEIQGASVSGSDTKPRVDINEVAQTTSFEAKDNMDMLFKCALIVKFVNDTISVEMSFLDGSSREAMHQVGQYIKNQFVK